jgi:IS30 family transposase
MVSIHLCPPEIEDRVMLGHWEGDLIKGKVTALRWAPCLNDATATSAVEGFSAALNRMPLAVRQSMTYDQGRQMAKHAEITQNTGWPFTSATRIAPGGAAATRTLTA